MKLCKLHSFIVILIQALILPVSVLTELNCMMSSVMCFGEMVLRSSHTSCDSVLHLNGLTNIEPYFTLII